MFRLGEIVVWTTQWGTKYLGEIEALFLDHRSIECLYAKCIDHDLSERNFRFIADVSSCKIFIGRLPLPVIEGKFSVIPTER